jgi:hypothetical protein
MPARIWKHPVCYVQVCASIDHVTRATSQSKNVGVMLQKRCLNFPRAVFESIAVEILKDQVWCPENLVLRCVNVFSRPECDKQLLIVWIQQEVAWLEWLLFVFDRV